MHYDVVITRPCYLDARSFFNCAFFFPTNGKRHKVPCGILIERSIFIMATAAKQQHPDCPSISRTWWCIDYLPLFSLIPLASTMRMICATHDASSWLWRILSSLHSFLQFNHILHSCTALPILFLIEFVSRVLSLYAYRLPCINPVYKDHVQHEKMYPRELYVESSTITWFRVTSFPQSLGAYFTCTLQSSAKSSLFKCCKAYTSPNPTLLLSAFFRCTWWWLIQHIKYLLFTSGRPSSMHIKRWHL